MNVPVKKEFNPRTQSYDIKTDCPHKVNPMDLIDRSFVVPAGGFHCLLSCKHFEGVEDIKWNEEGIEIECVVKCSKGELK